MFEAICAAIFILVASFAFVYFYMVLINAFWNSKYGQKIKKEAEEATKSLILTGKESHKMLDEIILELDEIKKQYK